MDWAAQASRIVVGKGDTNHLKWDGKPGHYEVWFLTLNARAERLGFWLRYTLDAPRSGAPYRELWAHVFDAAAPDQSFGVRSRFPVEGPLAGPHELFSTPGAVLQEGRARGRAEGAGHVVEWDLAYDPDPCSAFLAPYLFRKLKISKTSLVLTNPDARFRGRVAFDGREIALARAPGCQTHLWGTEHLERWAWGHCNAFDGRDDCSFDGVAGFVRRLGREIGPLPALYLRYRGLDYCLNALPRLWRAKSLVNFPTWSFEGRARDLRFRGTFSAPAQRFLQVRYEDPDGTPSLCANTEVADLVLEVFRGDRLLDRLSASGTAHVEFGTRRPLPGVRASVWPSSRREEVQR
ncbi:MAG TPA: hypothetical protein VGK67_16045 [Myxococcales bacterium]|jgi:hypothetical protein